MPPSAQIPTDGVELRGIPAGYIALGIAAISSFTQHRRSPVGTRHNPVSLRPSRWARGPPLGPPHHRIAFPRLSVDISFREALQSSPDVVTSHAKEGRP